jgi:hypothetical protein
VDAADVTAEVMGFEQRKLQREGQLRRLLEQRQGGEDSGSSPQGSTASRRGLPAWRQEGGDGCGSGSSLEPGLQAPRPSAAALQRALLADVEAARRRHKEGFLR